MLFSLIKSTTDKSQFKLYTPFIVKSQFIDFELKKCINYKDFRVDYLPVVNKKSNYSVLVRVWYLVLALRMVKIPLVIGKMAVFSYRRAKLFSKYQDVYALSLNKHFYETLVEHRNTFYCFTLSTLSIDRLYLILCLYSLKIITSEQLTVIKKRPFTHNSCSGLINFILRYKWKFNVLEFVQ